MDSDRKIGKIVSISTYNATIELDKDAQSFVKNSYSGIHKIGIINSYVVIPLGPDKIVGIVTKVYMFEDSELNYKNSTAIMLPRSKRTMIITMIGSIITKSNQENFKISKFEYGVVGYPSLDNPVWSITEDELNIIFRTKTKETKKYIKIGKSKVFPDYDITLDMDNFFGKHAAILGNTGSGKSCTVTAIIKAVLDDKPEMKNAHFIIFDTNNEYESAFTEYADEKKDKVKKTHLNRLIIRDKGLRIPHWFMNGEDYEALFTPSGQIQAPILSQSIIRARNSGSGSSSILNFTVGVIQQSIVVLRELIVRTNGAVTYEIRNQCLAFQNPTSRMRQLLDTFKQELSEFNIDTIIETFNNILVLVPDPGSNRGNPNWVIPTPDQRIFISEALNSLDASLQAQVMKVNSEMINLTTTIDSPKKFDFKKYINIFLEEEIQEQERTAPRVRADMSTLLLRIKRMFRDPRYDFFFKIKPFEYSLASFLRLILGEDPSYIILEQKMFPGKIIILNNYHCWEVRNTKKILSL